MQTTIKRTYNVNRLVQIEALTGMVFQAESGGHLFQISGIDNAGEAVALSGTVSGVFLRPDNTDVALTGSVSGGVVSVPLKAECYAVPGRFGLTLYISAGGSKTAIYAAMGTVSRTSSGQVAPTVTADVVDLVNRIAAAVNSIPATYTDLQADIAPTYSDTAVYAVGQFAWYNGDLKRCKTAITTPETYTAAHWENGVLGNDLNADITGLKSALNAYVQKNTITLAKENASGNNVFVLDVPIPAQIEITLANNSSDTTFTAIFIDVDRGVHNIGSMDVGQTRTSVFEKDIVEFRAIILSGSTINASISYGEELVRRLKESESNISILDKSATIYGNSVVYGWENQNYDSATNRWINVNNRITIKTALNADTGKYISCMNGYNFAVRKWSDANRTPETFISTTAWNNSGVLVEISPGDIFDITLRKPDDSAINTQEGINCRIYINDKNLTNYAYNVTGTPINVNTQSYNVTQISHIRSTPPGQITPTVGEVQDFAIYNNTIFQLYSSNVLFLIDYNTNAKTQLSITSGHGDAVAFSNEFYNDTDEFPLLYITSDSEEDGVTTVFVNRVTRNETQLVRTLSFPVARVGYYAALSLDADNNTLYQIGYTRRDTYDPTNNDMIVTKWDLNKLTDNGNGTYTPEYLEEFNIPFYPVTQGQSFINGKIVIISSAGVNPSTEIIFIDPTAHKISAVLKDFPTTIKTVETEGVAFKKDISQYFMVIKTANVFYYRVDFS